MSDLLHGQITEKIIGAAFEVHNALGKRLAEKTYEYAVAVKLQNLGLNVRKQENLAVFFDGKRVGTRAVDLLVEYGVIVEIKTVQTLTKVHQPQVLGYLKNTKYEVVSSSISGGK